MQTKKLIKYTNHIHGVVCNCDDKHCREWQEIEDWLQMGDLSDRDDVTLGDLTFEYIEYHYVPPE